MASLITENVMSTVLVFAYPKSIAVICRFLSSALLLCHVPLLIRLVLVLVFHLFLLAKTIIYCVIPYLFNSKVCA